MLGSLGQADLAPMADLAHGVIGDFPLTGSETLSLVNSNAFSTAIATLALADCHMLLDSLDVAGALDLEAFAANLSVLHPAVARVRPYPGIVTSIEPFTVRNSTPSRQSPSPIATLIEPFTVVA